MAKYIIDIPFETDFIAAVRMEHGLPVEMKCKKHETLELYTEPNRKAIEDEVWEFATICTKMNGADSVDVFGDYSLDSFTKYSYQEAKAKYEAWKKQKDEIHVGDEVKSDDGVRAAVLDLSIKNDIIIVFTEKNHIEKWEKIHTIEKTGRHFDEVEKLVRRMREE